jgi:hypothetical protein
MKARVGALCILLAGYSGSAFAARKYGMAGCGLGSIVFGTGNPQISAGTTNTSFNSQLFGITTGTSNCTPDAESAAVLKQESYVVANYATLSKELAQGQGQSVAGLAEVLGCESSVVPQFGSFAQSKYDALFLAPGSMAMLDKLKLEMASNETLSSSCSYSKIF